VQALRRNFGCGKGCEARAWPRCEEPGGASGVCGSREIKRGRGRTKIARFPRFRRASLLRLTGGISRYSIVVTCIAVRDAKTLPYAGSIAYVTAGAASSAPTGYWYGKARPGVESGSKLPHSKETWRRLIWRLAVQKIKRAGPSQKTLGECRRDSRGVSGARKSNNCRSGRRRRERAAVSSV